MLSVSPMLDALYSIVEIKFINCLAELMRQLDGAVRWDRVNRHFKVIDLAGGNMWNRHQLECDFNQSAFRIRPTCCISTYWQG